MKRLITKGIRKNARAVKFSEDELKRIDDFLQLNPFLDFSKLIRVAVLNFLDEPRIQLKKRVSAPIESPKAIKPEECPPTT